MKSRFLSGFTWLPHAILTQLGPRGATMLMCTCVNVRREWRKDSWELCECVCVWGGGGSRMDAWIHTYKHFCTKGDHVVNVHPLSCPIHVV